MEGVHQAGGQGTERSLTKQSAIACAIFSLTLAPNAMFFSVHCLIFMVFECFRCRYYTANSIAQTLFEVGTPKTADSAAYHLQWF